MMDDDIRHEFDQRRIPVDVSLECEAKKRETAWTIASVGIYLPESCPAGKVPQATILDLSGGLFKSRDQAEENVRAKVEARIGDRPGWKIVYRWDEDKEEE